MSVVRGKRTENELQVIRCLRDLAKQRRKIKKLYAKEIKGEVLQGTCNQSMQSYMANARRGDTYHVRSKVAKYYYEISGVDYHGYVKRREKTRTA